MASTREVAQQAGVSIGTVSRVLNNKPGVSEPTRLRVLAVAQELSYIPPRHQSFPFSAVTHLGLLVRPMAEDLTANPFYADVYHGVEQICRQLRITLSFSSLDFNGDRLRSLPPLTNDERIKGVILVGAIPPAVVEAVVASVQLPAVLVDNWFPRCAWDAVMIDNPTGANMATEYLITRGHRRITFISGPDHPSIVERRSGYEETLRRHHLTPAVINVAGLDAADGKSAVGELLQRWPETTAIICSNDTQALGVLRKLKELGYRVPEDFSLVGFDDISLAQFTSPPITTIRVDRHALGRSAVELLLGRISVPHRPPIKSIIGVTLVERASACQPRRLQ
jgi:LacI family transcriptional regulator